jgi:hypothetical protein
MTAVLVLGARRVRKPPTPLQKFEVGEYGANDAVAAPWQEINPLPGRRNFAATISTQSAGRL